ncbi:MAG: coproporphyrinogen III oxidase family protein [Defluviitaleaceae bacterium]|nr:coproporphyrinogen III oxidase family protein [Defluviitaleaceae bacterium]
MQCVLIGHKHVNEVQTVAQVFFPGERFNAVKVQYRPHTYLEAGYTIESWLEEEAAYASVYKDGEFVAGHKWPFCCDDIKPGKYLTERRVIMLALYHALQKAVGAYTPWGALTGIRPSKLVREWLEAGHSGEDITKTLTEVICCHKEKARLALAVAHAENRLTPPPGTIGLYVSIPFCPTRCVYCSFNTSHKPADTDLQRRYCDALAGECFEKARQARAMGAAISSIYIGGGTPTVLSEVLLEKVLEAVGEAFNIAEASERLQSPRSALARRFSAPPAEDRACLENLNNALPLPLSIEYTVEAGRPDTLTPGKLALMRRYGVNRIAVNPQTLNDHTLAAIGRGHTAADFFAAFEMTRNAGFACINTDLIVGLPGETPDDTRRTMEELARLSPENITVHTLAVKRASRLNELIRLEHDSQKTPGQSRDEAVNVEAMLRTASKACAEMGLSPYYLYRQKNMVGLFENVGYSLPGHECSYNIGMMAEVQTILGIGAGAVSKFVERSRALPSEATGACGRKPHLEGDKITREFNAKNPEIYIERRNCHDSGT